MIRLKSNPVEMNSFPINGEAVFSLSDPETETKVSVVKINENPISRRSYKYIDRSEFYDSSEVLFSSRKKDSDLIVSMSNLSPLSKYLITISEVSKGELLSQNNFSSLIEEVYLKNLDPGSYILRITSISNSISVESGKYSLNFSYSLTKDSTLIDSGDINTETNRFFANDFIELKTGNIPASIGDFGEFLFTPKDGSVYYQEITTSEYDDLIQVPILDQSTTATENDLANFINLRREEFDNYMDGNGIDGSYSSPSSTGEETQEEKISILNVYRGENFLIIETKDPVDTSLLNVSIKKSPLFNNFRISSENWEKPVIVNIKKIDEYTLKIEVLENDSDLDQIIFQE